MTPDRGEIASFLETHVRSDIHLVVIWPDGPIVGQWFGDNASAAAEWAELANASGYNVYWTGNVANRSVRVKPSKSLMTAARFLHVDVDPQPGVPWDIAAVTARLRETGAPSFIVGTGNGVQALWRLDAPIDLTPDIYETIEGMDRSLALEYQGDDCWNIDRLLRVPGTINYPDAGKRARGYVVQRATLLQPDTGATYSLGGLAERWPYIARPRSQRVAGEADLGNYVLLGPDDLDPAPSDRLRAMIGETGLDGIGRSQHIAAVAVEMARCSYTNEQIAGILMNPANAVHAHVADQRNMERAVARPVAIAEAHRPTAVFAAAPVLPTGVAVSPEPVGVAGKLAVGGLVMPDDMPDYFHGCVWIEADNQVWTPTGDVLDKSRFDIRYGGHKFQMDKDGHERPSTSAWDAFTVFRGARSPRVGSTCFRPELPPGHIVREEGRTLLNTWMPIETKRIAGDVSRFTDFLRRLLPVAGDRDILLAYMASLVQNPGRKFQWWPVVQGTEGNGKTLILRCLQHAVGMRYTHLPNTSALAKEGLKFNRWIMGNLLCGVEEISLGHKRDFLEEFKPVVTNDRMPIEGKGVDQITGDNRMNGMLFTNHRDGVPVTVDTRRYAIFYTAQQSAEDKERDGMGGRYFVDLYAWMRGEGAYEALGASYGYAVVADWLARYDIPAALDPARDCVVAPRTSSFAAAIGASLGRAEQEVLEAIEQGLTGFAGGWVSSLYLDRLLDQVRTPVPRNKRRDMMRMLGYEWHPALKDGRVNNSIAPDGSKPRLYIRKGHPLVDETDPVAVARHYTESQSGAGNLSNVIPFTPRR